MKSAKARVHKHSAEINFTSSTFKKQVPTEREVKWDLEEPHKEETAWFWRSPEAIAVGKSGIAPSARFKRSPMSSTTASYWSSRLQFHLPLIESPVLPTQTATFLLVELPSAWAPSPLVKAIPFLFLCPAAPLPPLCLGQPRKYPRYAALPQAWSLSGVLSHSLATITTKYHR